MTLALQLCRKYFYLSHKYKVFSPLRLLEVLGGDAWKDQQCFTGYGKVAQISNLHFFWFPSSLYLHSSSFISNNFISAVVDEETSSSFPCRKCEFSLSCEICFMLSAILTIQASHSLFCKVLLSYLVEVVKFYPSLDRV